MNTDIENLDDIKLTKFDAMVRHSTVEEAISECKKNKTNRAITKYYRKYYILPQQGDIIHTSNGRDNYCYLVTFVDSNYDYFYVRKYKQDHDKKNKISEKVGDYETWSLRNLVGGKHMFDYYRYTDTPYIYHGSILD